MKGVYSMQATELAKSAIAAWETSDVQKLSACLSDNFVCWQLFPQPAAKPQFLDCMQAIMQAIPDWSFQAMFLNEHPVKGQPQLTRVHFAIRVSGHHSGKLVLLGLPVIHATDMRIALPLRHMDFTLKDGLIEEIAFDSSPNLLAELLGALGMVLP
jgi:hypothetical protein